MHFRTDNFDGELAVNMMEESIKINFGEIKILDIQVFYSVAQWRPRVSNLVSER